MGSTNNTKVVGEDHQVRGWAYVTQEINPHKTHNKQLSLLSSIFLGKFIVGLCGFHVGSCKRIISYPL